MHRDKRICREKVSKNKNTAFLSGIIAISLFGVLALPLTSFAFTYDDYFLVTQNAGKNIAHGITAGANNTQTLYRNAWNELASIPKGLTFLSFKVKPLLASYAQYSNTLGKTFAQTLTAGLGASQEFSQTIWGQGPAFASLANAGPSFSSYAEFSQNMGEVFADTVINYVTKTNTIGNTIADGIKDGFKNSANLYAKSLAAIPRFDLPTEQAGLNAPQGRTLPVQLASLTDVWNSTTNYVSNLWNNVTTPAPKQPTTNNTQPTTKVKPPATKPIVTPTTPKPVATPAPEPTKNYKPLTTNSSPPPPQQLVVERTVERVLSGITSADLELKMQQLRNELVAKIGSVSAQSQTYYVGNSNAIALTNKIDQLTNTVITTPTITGGTISNASISGGTISGTTISGTTLTVSSGTFSGNLTVSGTATSTFAGDSNFDAGTLYIDSLNNRVGVGTSSPTDTLALAGPLYFSQVSAPSVTINRLYNESGNLTWNGTVIGGASTGQWTLSGSDVYRSSGNVGIGTTSPYAKLSVVGETVSTYFTATSTTKSTFPYASSTALTISGSLYTPLTANSVPFIGTNGILSQNTSNFVWDNTNFRLGIGTTSPYAALSVVGETVSSYFTATSTTGTSIFAGGLSVNNGAIQHNFSTGITSIGNLELGSLSFDTDAGTVSWIDMPVTSASALGTVHSYSAQLDGNPLLTVYGQSYGEGNIKLSAVGIGTTTPTARLTVSTASTTELIPLFTVASSTGASLFTINYDGNIGIGTTSPWLPLSVAGRAVITATTTIGVSNTSQQAGIQVGFGGICVDNDGTCTASTTGRVSAVSYTTGATDLAENYTSSQPLQAGDIVETTGGDTVGKADGGSTVIGIVSTKPGIILGLGNDTETPDQYPIALAGRVPVKVNLDGGEIKKGDRITLSSTSGVGMKATTSTYTVGIALEDFTSQTPGTVLAFVNLTWSKLDPSISNGTIATVTGKESSFWNIDESSGRIKFIDGLDLNDFDIIGVKAIIGSAGKWSIDGNGRLVVNEVQTNRLCVGDTCVTQDEFKKVFGSSQAAQVSVTPPPTDTTTPSSTPPVSGSTDASTTPKVLDTSSTTPTTPDASTPPAEANATSTTSTATSTTS